MFRNNQIIITSEINKKNLLKKRNNQLLNIKIYSINEFNKLYYFDYNEKTIAYIMSKYSVKYEIAKIYLKNLYYIESKKYNSSKLNFLSQLKEELISENLLIINNLFRLSISKKDIVIYNLPSTKELTMLIDLLKKNNNVTVMNDPVNKFNHTILEFSSIEDEVEYIANSICNMIKKGIDITHILLTNLDEEYRKLIKRIFPMFNIPFTINEQESIYGTFICSKFIELYSSDMNETMTNLKSFIKTEKDEVIYNLIINIVNKYVDINNENIVKEMIFSNLKNTHLPKKDILNSIHEVDLKDTIFTEEDYVYCLSFNQGTIPVNYKDEDYLNDYEKEELGISQTIDKNKLEKEIIFNKISSIPNLTITYKLNANGEVCYLSSINEELSYPIEEVKEDNLTNSNLNNKIKLSTLLDEYYKYGTTSNLLYTLNNQYNDIPYNTYDHKFKGIDNEVYKTFIKNKITLSYSSLDKYYRCPFSFYVGNILRLNIFEETFYQLVGTLFHSILEKSNRTSLSYDELWQEEVNALNHEWSPKEVFFLNKLKEELKFIIDVIQNQENFTNLHDELHEERIYTNIEGNIKITFTGIIDKIKYKKDNNRTIIAIIDYKTGNVNLDLTLIPYGIGMQLPVYLYLAKNSPKLENIKVAGFYLQKVLNNEVTVDKSKTYEQLKKHNLLLQGYSTDNYDILEEFDSTFKDSNIIKSMKVKNDGSFYNYVNALSDDQMDLLINLTEKKIKDAAKKITNGEFTIAPKKLDKENLGCHYCNFRDICFHTAKDIVELTPLKKEDVIGGKYNELD